jgi:hypothetical protein
VLGEVLLDVETLDLLGRRLRMNEDQRARAALDPVEMASAEGIAKRLDPGLAWATKGAGDADP